MLYCDNTMKRTLKGKLVITGNCKKDMQVALDRPNNLTRTLEEVEQELEDVVQAEEALENVRQGKDQALESCDFWSQVES